MLVFIEKKITEFHQIIKLFYGPRFKRKELSERFHNWRKSANRLEIEKNEIISDGSRSQYSEQIVKLSNNKYIIDKLPLNFKWIGFIIKAFPEAKIIHLERNAMAVCWSNYKINFRDSGMDIALSQKDIAEYYTLYDDLMKFWYEKFNAKIININYEKFVSNYEKEAKNLIDKLSLNWEENLKNYNKNNDQPVETASLHQVRGKIIKNTSEQWKIYKNFLTEMQDTLKVNKINF